MSVCSWNRERDEDMRHHDNIERREMKTGRENRSKSQKRHQGENEQRLFFKKPERITMRLVSCNVTLIKQFHTGSLASPMSHCLERTRIIFVSTVLPDNCVFGEVKCRRETIKAKNYHRIELD